MYKPLDNETKILYNLKEVEGLCEVEFTDENDWLEKRKDTIGGSEIGIVLGLNEYSSKLQLYKSKRTGATRPDTMYTRKGREIEELIFKNYVVPYFEKIHYKVYKPNRIFVKEESPWLSANLDGLAIPDLPYVTSNDNVVVEIKWVSQWGSSKWETSEEYGNIPASYYAQVQDYMYHINASKAVVFAMFDDTWTCESYVIDRNESFIRKMLMDSEIFYRTHLLTDIPPAADIRFDSSDIAHKLETEFRPEQKKSEEFDLLLAKYKALKSSEKELDEELKTTLNTIISMHLEGYVPDNTSLKFICTSRTTHSVDTKLLKERYPEIAEQVMKASTYTWTSIK